MSSFADALFTARIAFTLDMPKLSFRTGFFLFLLSAAYVVAGSLFDNKRFQQHFDAFNQAEFAGPIHFVGPAYKGVALEVHGSRTQRYIFYPQPDPQLNDGQAFLALASKGDYVQKNAYSDTLVVRKGTKRYRYLFKVPGSNFFLPYRLP